MTVGLILGDVGLMLGNAGRWLWCVGSVIKLPVPDAYVHTPLQQVACRIRRRREVVPQQMNNTARPAQSGQQCLIPSDSVENLFSHMQPRIMQVPTNKCYVEKSLKIMIRHGLSCNIRKNVPRST